MRMYRMYILPEWKTLDVIEHTEERSQSKDPDRSGSLADQEFPVPLKLASLYGRHMAILKSYLSMTRLDWGNAFFSHP